MRGNLSLSQRSERAKRAGSERAGCWLRACRWSGVLLSLALGLVYWSIMSDGDSILSDYHHVEALEEILNEPQNTTRLLTKPASRLVSSLLPAFQAVLDRARNHSRHCNGLNLPPKPFNITLDTDLPPFGIIDALTLYQQQSTTDHNDHNDWQCELPPPTECEATQFSVILMGYNPDRLLSVKQNVGRMLRGNLYSTLVKEIILVWNNPEPLESVNQIGQQLASWANASKHPFQTTEPNPFRVFLPLNNGLANDLMNRYHPKIEPKSKAILYYDDDGPFYMDAPIRSAFELWRRNANAQLGAMPRAFTFSPRQALERKVVMGQELDDRKFVSHCRNSGDGVEYDFKEFTPFHANMVLPSGSFLHRNYLCFLWHPALQSVRKFVSEHPVHPDDVTVSTVVSQLGGRSPLTYSRRLPDKRRRLQETNETIARDEEERIERRRLLWDDAEKRAQWGKWRSMAVNSLVAFFGSVTTGSLGWCYKTKYHKQKGDRHICDPEIARDGMLPWLEEGGFLFDTCPLIAL